MKIFFILFFSLTATLHAGLADDFTEEKGTHFIVYYKDVPADFVKTVIEFAEKYYDELTQKLEFTRYTYWTWDRRAKIYIYPDQETFQRETKQPGWAGGMASYEQKTIWTFPHGAGFFDSLLPHEIGHIVFREVIGSRTVPLWLEEGVACYLEQAKRIGSEKLVLDALGNKTFIPLEDLGKIDAASLRQYANANLFYAESISIVTYLVDKFGARAFNDFCRKLKDGKSLDDALSFAYFDLRNSRDLGVFWENALREKIKKKSATML